MGHSNGLFSQLDRIDSIWATHSAKDRAMDKISSLLIQILEAQLEVCRLQEIEFAREYEASSTNEQKEEIAIRWNCVMSKMQSLRSEVEQLEKMDVYSATLN
jgi:hypothetical protein